MKILLKSALLFLFGVYVDWYKHRFDCLMDRCIKSGGDISGNKLTKRSNNCYRLYTKFREYEKNLRYEMNLKKIIREMV